MTVADLILLGNGLKNDADSYSINIYRKTFDETGEVPFKSISTGLSLELNSPDPKKKHNSKC
jgi:hypothetical protein